MADINYPIANNDDFNQHKLDYAALIIDTKTPLKNNNFSLGTPGAFTANEWLKSDTIFNKLRLEYLPDKKAQKINMVYADQLVGQDFIVNAGDKIYYKINIIEKVDESKDIALYITLTDSINEYASYLPVNITSIGESQGIFTSTKNASVFCFTASDGINANAVVKEVEILNLTSIFGKGHEPTFEEIEEYGLSGLVNMRAFYNNIIALKDTTNELLKSQELINDLQFNINILLPSPVPKTLEFEVVKRGSWEEPKWMTSDGQTIYGNIGRTVLRSTDEWNTTEVVTRLPVGNNVSGVRDLEDGELIITTHFNTEDNIVSRVYKTIGYEGKNLNCDVKLVLEAKNISTLFTNHWGLDVYKNIVLLSDYGGTGVNGAKNVYLSTDYGNTFTEIFDLQTEIIEGRPPATETAHIHTVKYDPFYDRIWLCVGDRPNTATYYSDDLGETWTYVVGSDIVQFTGIQIFEDGVIFGSDSPPNGVYSYTRKGKEKHPIIKQIHSFNSDSLISHVGEMAYRKDFNKNTPCYFTFSGAGGTEYTSLLVGMVNSLKAYTLFEVDKNSVLNGRLYVALGDTAQGNIILSMYDREQLGYFILKTKAPEWK